MKPTRAMRKALLVCCLLGFAPFASAGVISFVPTPAFGDVGDTISVDLVWTGGADEYIGDWDFRITWDSSIVNWSSISLDPDFGVDSLGCLICDFPDRTQGDIQIYVSSLDTAADLMSNQDGLGNSFRLASFDFVGMANGATDLLLSALAIGDEAGDAIDPTLVNGRICVGPDGCPVNVPEPSTLALFSLGLLGLGFGRRRLAGKA